MASQDLQILVFVDLYPGVSVEELKGELPAERDDREVLPLTEFGAPRLEPPPDASPLDWPAIGRAVEQLAAKVRELRAGRSNPTVVFVGGKGPLPVFIHLGYLFSKFGGKQVVLNQPPSGGRWEHFAMEAPVPGEAPLFEPPEGLPSGSVYSSGYLGMYVDTSGRDTPEDVFVECISNEGEGVAGVVKLRSSKPLLITPENVSSVAQELAQFFSMAPSRFRKRSGLAIFFGGPVQAAFALGRALNPTVVGQNLWLTAYRHPAYERVYSLPFVINTEIAISRSAEAVLGRRNVLDEMRTGIADLKRFLKPGHLPAGILPDADRDKFIARLAELNPSRETKEDEPFELRVIEGRYTLGEGILQALVGSTPEQQQGFAKLLLLHELIHDWQTLRSTNYTSIGRACFVLEQVDYAADLFALQAIMNLELDIDGKRAHGEVAKRLQRWIELMLHGIQSFDFMEHGVKMERLSERRLRRYLLWHLQLARAKTVKEAPHVEEMLRPSLTVELAPLAGRIDTERHEKVITRALPESELFISIGGQLVRAPKRPGLDPGMLVEAVRTYADEPIQKVMVPVVDDHRARLARWNA
jgi:hypothetical protein